MRSGLWLHGAFPGPNDNSFGDFKHIFCVITSVSCTVMIQSFQTNMSGQTVQTKIRLLLEEQSDQGLHCLLFRLHLFDEIP